jgi:hypothetical protein
MAVGYGDVVSALKQAYAGVCSAIIANSCDLFRKDPGDTGEYACEAQDKYSQNHIPMDEQIAFKASAEKIGYYIVSRVKVYFTRLGRVLPKS